MPTIHMRCTGVGLLTHDEQTENALFSVLGEHASDGALPTNSYYSIHCRHSAHRTTLYKFYANILYLLGSVGSDYIRIFVFFTTTLSTTFHSLVEVVKIEHYFRIWAT